MIKIGVVKIAKDEITVIVDLLDVYKLHFFDVERLKLNNADLIEGQVFQYQPKFEGKYTGYFQPGTVKRVEEKIGDIKS